MSVEMAPLLASRARTLLADWPQVSCIEGPGSSFYRESFAKVLFCFHVPKVPASLLAALPVGGKLLAPVGGTEGQTLMLYERTAEGVKTSEHGDVVYVADRERPSSAVRVAS